MDTKHITFTPAICKPAGDEPAAYEGSVTIRRPDYIERMALKEIDSDSGGDEDEPKKADKWQLLKSMAKKAPAFIVELKLKRLDDGYEFKTFDELLEDGEAGSVAIEICSQLVKKYQAGKGQTPS